MGAMSTPESGASWFVAHDGIVTDPVGGHSTTPAEDWVPPTADERRASAEATAHSDTSPAPGTGTVSISPVMGEWYALWDYAEEGVPDSYRSLEGPSGMTREQAIEWALEQDAERVLLHDGQDWVPISKP